MLRRMERMASAEDDTPILGASIGIPVQRDSSILWDRYVSTICSCQSIAVAENSVNKQSGLLVHRDNTFDIQCGNVTHPADGCGNRVSYNPSHPDFIESLLEKSNDT
jgi:hypothetical protein